MRAAILRLCMPFGAALLLCAAPSAGQQPALLRQLVDVLNTGDQAAYERFAQANYAPAALADTPAEDQAAALARIYAETGGFVVDKAMTDRADLLQAQARDRIVGLRYCLTLKQAQTNGRPFITEFSRQSIFPAGSALTDPAPQEVALAVDKFSTAFSKRDLFSGVVLIAKGDDIILEKAYGAASIAFDRPLTLNTRLNVASIGKSLTGTAIAQLVEAKRMSYEDNVGKFLPDYPVKDVRDNVTIRQLLSHTSGLGPDDFYQLPGWAAARPNLRSVADYMKLVGATARGAKPGEYLYSNSGYVLLGATIERVTGESFYDYIAQHVFAPAGMSHSLYHQMDAEDPDIATPLTNLFTKGDGFIFRLGRPRSAIYELPARGGPQGGAYMTVDDLFAFERALRSGKLIGLEALRQMLTPQSPSGAGASGLSGDAREGLGIEVVTQNGHTFYGHTGGDLGVASMVYWYPDLGYTTIALTNRDPRAARVLLNMTRALLTRHTLGNATPPAQTCISP